ncbi:MAG: protein kinase [Deltaproteobacteria bacterium]|jgi:serine/threonine-protein kinase|nr:protein kinase [Deltaproteobacteria bacterium]MBW2532310.1 protein kinase [Deltaproteobacteria bacterium]
MTLKSVDLLVEDLNPPQVEIKGLTGTLSPPSKRKAPPPPSKRRDGDGLPKSAAPDPRRHYFDDGEIGRGGMGAIRVAVDNRLHRRVAMKTFEGKAKADPNLVRRFVDEAQITGQLDHPNIAPIYELAFESGQMPAFFTMKLVQGKDLDDLLAELGDDRLTSANLERLVQILLKACEAVSFAHSHGVIHRDLKPANLMVGSHGQVYVMDWGLALVRTGKRAYDPEAERQRAVGTPAYMAPEQASGRVEDIDERTDVYGLGGILYAMLTAKAPHAAGNAYAALEKARRGKVKPPAEVVKDKQLPPELRRIARKALAPRRIDRYGTVAELQQELQQFLRGGGWLETRTYKKGAEIIAEGDDADEAFIVVEGTCEAYKMVGKKRVSLRRMGPGEVFGETVFLTGKKRMASVRAVDQVTVKVLNRESLEQELAGNSWMKSFVTVLAERFREVATKLTDITEGLTK